MFIKFAWILGYKDRLNMRLISTVKLCHGMWQTKIQMGFSHRNAQMNLSNEWALQIFFNYVLNIEFDWHAFTFRRTLLGINLLKCFYQYHFWIELNRFLHWFAKYIYLKKKCMRMWIFQCNWLVSFHFFEWSSILYERPS